MVTDNIQPFPLPGVAKLEFRDIVRYCPLHFVLYMIIIAAFRPLPVCLGI